MDKVKFKKRMTSVNVRLPEEIREKAKEIAKRESTEDAKVFEATVYRKAIELFFEHNGYKM